MLLQDSLSQSMIIQSSKSSDFSLSLTPHSQSISHPFGSILKMYLISNYFSLLPTSPLLPSEPPSSVTGSQLILLLPLCLRFSKQKARVILIQQDHITLLLCSRPINCFSLVQNKMAYKVHNWPQEPSCFTCSHSPPCSAPGPTALSDVLRGCEPTRARGFALTLPALQKAPATTTVTYFRFLNKCHSVREAFSSHSISCNTPSTPVHALLHFP